MEGEFPEENPKSTPPTATLLADHHDIPIQVEISERNEDNDGGKNPLMDAVQFGIEMEEQNIAEEITASDFIRTQKLEDEVKMEQVMEKQIMGSSESDGDSKEKLRLTNNPVGGVDDLQHVSSDLIKSNVFGDEEDQVNDVALGKLPFELNSNLVAAQTAGKSVDKVGGEEVSGQGMPCSTISGMKRKVETSAQIDTVTTSVASKELQKKKWYCSLCDVSATSAGGLNLHLHGRKHKAKEALSKSCKTVEQTKAHVPSIEEEDIQVKPMKEQRTQVKPTEEDIQMGQPTEEKRTQVKPMEEEDIPVKPIEEQRTQVKPMEEEDIQVKPMEELRTQAKPMEEEDIQVKPMEEQRAQVKLMEEQRTQVKPMEEEDIQVKPMEEQRAQLKPMEEDKNEVLVEKEKTQATKKWECSLCQVSATSELLLRSHLLGKKHKAKEAKLGISQVMKEKNEVPHKWYCSICKVSAASEKNLIDHFQGKKHKANAGIIPEENDSLDSKPIEKTSEDMNIINKHEIDNNLNIKAKFDGDTSNNKETIQELVKVWFCKMCNEEANDEAGMANHRKSSKHKDKLRKNGGGLIVVSSMLQETIGS